MLKVNELSNLAETVSVRVEDIANMFKDYVDNASAVAGGLSVGALYYNTTDEKVTKVK